MDVANIARLYDVALPYSHAPVMGDFDVRAALGRKDTSALDRGTGLVLVACARALKDSGLSVNDQNRHRIGIVLGTSCGSLKSMSDFTIETLTESKPYLVNPMLFPNTVMNRAAGQAAIRHGLKGVNATVAGEQLAFLAALQYASMAIRRGNADVLLTGAFEEFTPHRAWAAWVTGPSPATLPVGEAAAVFVLEASDECGHAGRHVCGEVLAVTASHGPLADVRVGLATSIRRGPPPGAGRSGTGVPGRYRRDHRRGRDRGDR